MREDDERERHLARQQDYVNRLLNRAVVFSIIWLAGLGSLYSVYLATKARRIILASNGAVTGLGRVWWCFIVGGCGALFVASCLAAILLNGAN